MAVSKLMLGVVAMVAAGAWLLMARAPSLGAKADRTRLVAFYRDPMHPTYTSATPGKAPDCGMDLVPVYAEKDAADGPAARVSSHTVRLDEEMQQAIGVRIGRVEQRPSLRTIRTFGRVVADENRTVVLTAGGDGWVTRLDASSSTGDVVRKGQALASVYGREYTTAQRTYLFALNAAENPPPSNASQEND